MNDLDTRIIAAHEVSVQTGDQTALVDLYTEAANAANDLDAKCFFLTHAYIFALASGAPQAPALHARLVSHGREE